MNIIKGDLIKLAKEREFDVILHGCNCFNVMGAGIARQIAKEFPEAYAIDKMTCKGDVYKLGYLTSATLFVNKQPLTICNLYTQYRSGNNFDEASLEGCLDKVRKWFYNQRIGYPKIGCGIGGGDWERVKYIFDYKLRGMDHTLVEYEGTQ